MNLIYVFKTSVETPEQIKQVGAMLDDQPEITSWNFDLDDRDRVLRIEARQLNVAKLTNAVGLLGFYCEELADDVEKKA